MIRGRGRFDVINIITNALQEVAGRHWKSLPVPAQAKTILLESLTSAFDIHSLANFWSNLKVVDYIPGENFLAAYGVSWFIALSYLKNGSGEEAIAL